MKGACGDINTRRNRLQIMYFKKKNPTNQPCLWKAKPSIRMLCAVKKVQKPVEKMAAITTTRGSRTGGKGCSTVWREIKSWWKNFYFLHIWKQNSSMNAWLPIFLLFRSLDKMTIHSLILEQSFAFKVLYFY